MSSGSYFTMYRKYNAVASDDVYNALCKQYLNARHDLSENAMSDEEFLKNLPIVLSFSYGLNESEYCDKTKTWKDVKDYSIEGQRKQYQALLNEDKSYLDKLMTWDFGSGFTCIKDTWNLNAYSLKESMCIVDKATAEKILQACNYLLSENWSNDFEKILNNEWIKTIASDNHGESYWKYVYRDDKKSLREISAEEQESAEYNINKLRNVMDTFINNDSEYSSYGLVKNILVYEAW